MRAIIVALAVMIVLPCSVFPQAVPAGPLDGSYELRSMWEDGKEYPAIIRQAYQEVTIANGELTLRSTAGIDTAKFTLDATKAISEIDFTSTKVGEKKTAAGIYKIEKSELIILFHKGGVRPTDFKATGKDVVKLVLVKRPPNTAPPKK